MTREPAALAADIAELLSVLDQREREMLALRFGFNGHRPRHLKKLGTLFDVKPERARQIHVGAMAKLTEAAARSTHARAAVGRNSSVTSDA